MNDQHRAIVPPTLVARTHLAAAISAILASAAQFHAPPAAAAAADAADEIEEIIVTANHRAVDLQARRSAQYRDRH